MNNKLLAFVAALRGRPVKSQYGLGGTCVDLVEAWLATIGQSPVGGNAADLLGNADPRGWLTTTNSPYNYPAPGDVVVWRQGPGTFGIHLDPDGHCAVCVAADSMWLLSFDQNWPEGSKAELVMHGYLGVAGWLTSRK